MDEASSSYLVTMKGAENSQNNLVHAVIVKGELDALPIVLYLIFF